ncbi:hypothetical protein [Elizabethkingia meningoseptica]|jgi:hypothetical protein|uniref:hypothetical protein n=1 Tax=Elizabethkingia meningoseptica TaxID=238 RepID=UPI000841AF54|nr:hypothetical protein [Elizabethkingia meningoseptica]MDV3704708.1 hypothetical protein [Elizabethkingia anophelis]MDV3712619.1 hypothetical protein [Elizabethkingia anophelis]MDV3767336.1 hypothetical protein [Elizabethkingia anophelis]ODM53846.1 hypothetical protein BES09_06480 [Elizabethkingia meningoseptica]OHT29074.1 hypothetical protein BFF93_06490 [Elizabethkingia meningoseptica]
MDKAKKIEKWKYKNGALNSFKSDDKEFEKLSEIIDTANKNDLKEIFNNDLEARYDQYKKYLYGHNLFLFRDLEQHIKDSVHCLIINAYIPSITNTNLLLERALKLVLIQFEVGTVADYGDEEIIKKYIQADKMYAGRSMDKNIQKCKKYKILSEEEASELTKYKLKFRDGFSHFTPANILGGEEKLISIPLGQHAPDFERKLKMPSYQSMQVIHFATMNAENHLAYVLDILNHLQYKVLEQFSKK